MKNFGIIMVLILITLTGLWVWAVVGPNQTPQERMQQKLLSEGKQSNDSFTKQSNDQGEVSIEATPVVLEPGKEAKFNVVFNTHSVELDYDLLKLSSLSDDKGNKLAPISWSGGSGGHHLNGELVFPSISAKAKSAQLIIANISGFDRSFIWNL